MAKIYQVKLTLEQRKTLHATVNKGSAKAQRQRRASTLLLADAGRSDQAIAAALQSGRATVERTCRRFFEEGLEAARASSAGASEPAAHRSKLHRLYPSTQT